MADTAEHISRLEAFFQRRSDDPDSLKVVDYEVITGGYSRAMSKVFVEDSSGRRGYIIRADPPPGQAIIDTDRATEWSVLSTLYASGQVPMPVPALVRPDGRGARQPGHRDRPGRRRGHDQPDPQGRPTRTTPSGGGAWPR